MSLSSKLCSKWLLNTNDSVCVMKPISNFTETGEGKLVTQNGRAAKKLSVGDKCPMLIDWKMDIREERL